ncbi:MAG: leucine-rich repeat protein [Clostridia bacterium]|nr:leucine-rich repeat protein [Clostridia bacterium]
MAEQIFISYRRMGGDVTAKLICESLKSHGYTVFYDHDSIHGGYFVERIISSIEGCDDFLLILPEGGLDRCVNEKDYVRQEIAHALKCKKNIIPLLLPGFTFPENLPEDIAVISGIHGVKFVMDYYDAMIIQITERLKSKKSKPTDVVETPTVLQPHTEEAVGSEGLEYILNADRHSYSVEEGACTVAHIVIPSTYREKPVTKIGNSAFDGCTSLMGITIPSSVISIGNRAFEDCDSLTDITIPGSVASIGNGAFWGCYSLTDITLPSSVTGIGNGAFWGCSSLRSIAIPERVTTIGDMTFFVCSSLTDITIPGSVTCIGDGAFTNCSALTAITLPDSITRIGGWAFTGCFALSTIRYEGTMKMWKRIRREYACLADVPAQFVECIDGKISIS